MKDIDLTQDISLLTSVPYKTLKNIWDKGNECVCHSVLESTQNGNVETIIDICIGKLTIITDHNEIYYKFRPSSELENMLINTLTTNKDPLIGNIEQKLVSRILNTYKDLV